MIGTVNLTDAVVENDMIWKNGVVFKQDSVTVRRSLRLFIFVEVISEIPFVSWSEADLMFVV